MKKIELLAPAGDLERLKIAILYGADAVYLGGKQFSLRSRASNFDIEDIAKGVQFAKEHNAHVHVTVNMLPHEEDMDGLKEYLMELERVGVTAIIAASPTIMMCAKKYAPKLEVHVSTQHSSTNSAAANYWKSKGMDRVVLAREATLEEIKQSAKNSDVPLEVFLHGAMCISYSGRCTLSNHMSMRDANRGGCSQSCRWKYELFDMPFGTERRSKTSEGEVEEEFSMSAVDMSMIEHIPELIENGVDSFKIEGRMKSIHYVSTVANVYKKAVDSYMEDPENYVCQQEWIDELWKVAQRELATGFYYQVPTEEEQLFGPRRQIPQYAFVGQVLEYDPETQIATIQQRNNFKVGDHIEFYGPGMRHHEEVLTQLWDENGEEIEAAPHAMMICKMKVSEPVKPLDMIRKRR